MQARKFKTFFTTVSKYFILVYTGLYLIAVLFSILGVKPPYSPTENLINEQTYEVKRFLPVSVQHPFGTDFKGYDLFSQIYAGTKTNFIFSLLTSMVFLIFGTFFGIIIGYYGNDIMSFQIFLEKKNNRKSPPILSKIFLKIRNQFRLGKRGDVFTKVSDFFNSFPLLLLILILTLFLDPLINSTNIKLSIEMALFGLFSAPRLSTMLIGKIQTLRSEDFIQSSIALGLSNKQIIFKHILLSECKYIILFQTMYMMGQATILEITLTYLGYGAQFPWVSWGAILKNMKNAPFHINILFPVTVTILTIYMFMRIAEEIKAINEKRTI